MIQKCICLQYCIPLVAPYLYRYNGEDGGFITGPQYAHRCEVREQHYIQLVS